MRRWGRIGRVRAGARGGLGGGRHYLHGAVLQGGNFLRGEGTRLAAVILAAVLEPYLHATREKKVSNTITPNITPAKERRGGKSLLDSRQRERVGRQGQRAPRIREGNGWGWGGGGGWLEGTARTWTSFSLRETRLTMSRRAALSGLGLALYAASRMALSFALGGEK